jgi:hypothetical protein
VEGVPPSADGVFFCPETKGTKNSPLLCRLRSAYRRHEPRRLFFRCQKQLFIDSINSLPHNVVCRRTSVRRRPHSGYTFVPYARHVNVALSFCEPLYSNRVLWHKKSYKPRGFHPHQMRGDKPPRRKRGSQRNEGEKRLVDCYIKFCRSKKRLHL